MRTGYGDCVRTRFKSVRVQLAQKVGELRNTKDQRVCSCSNEYSLNLLFQKKSCCTYNFLKDAITSKQSHTSPKIKTHFKNVPPPPPPLFSWTKFINLFFSPIAVPTPNFYGNTVQESFILSWTGFLPIISIDSRPFLLPISPVRDSQADIKSPVSFCGRV